MDKWEKINIHTVLDYIDILLVMDMDPKTSDEDYWSHKILGNEYV